MSKYAQVVLATGLPTHLDYLLPEFEQRDLTGYRVKVPVRNKEVVAFVTKVTDTTTCPLAKLKAITTVLDDQPVLSSSLQALIHWASTYYHYPLAEVLKAALPKLLRTDRMLAIPDVWHITHRPQEQRLQTTPSSWLTRIDMRTLGYKAKDIQRLLTEKQISAVSQTQCTVRPSPVTLTTEQTNAVDTLLQHQNSFYPMMLEGVTGSGKTEVYLRCMAEVIAAGYQCLVLVPEINLTPQTLDRFRARFDCVIAVLHSGLTPKQRLDNWLLASSHLAPLVIGTRSAVFAPLAKPGLFIVDESHDASYKQQDRFRYSARNVMLQRAYAAQCPIILGSATPSLESLYNVNIGKYHLQQLTRRAGHAQLPPIEIIDTRHKKLTAGISSRLTSALKTCLEAKEQAFLFINRRGYAPTLFCLTCHWRAECVNCSTQLTLHMADQLLKCHHCGYKRELITTCPKCQASVAPVGFGTQKLEAHLQKLFPSEPIARIDSDSMTENKTFAELVTAIHQQHYRLLIGTQMLAKGHHFPNVTLVAILDIDGALFSSDFRSIEKMGQLITQVAGRAGRSQQPGRVFLQTCYPEHPSLMDLLQNGYRLFATTLLKERQQVGLPPYSYQALFQAKASSIKCALMFLTELKNNATILPGVQVLGPMPAIMERRVGFYRAHLLFQASHRSSLHRTLKEFLLQAHSLASSKIQWHLDIDPLETI